MEASRVTIVAADTPINELPGVTPGMEVILRGAPILALNPEANNLTASHRFLRHELVRNRYFFTLPRRLWDEAYQRIGADAFDPDLVTLEDELGAICRDHSTNAGLWRGRAFTYYHLQRLGYPQITPADAGLSITQAELDRQLQLAEERSGGTVRNVRGYLGWLLLNPRFLDEHDSLLQIHQNVISRWGTDAFGLPSPPPGFDRETTEWQAAFREADVGFTAFFCRWRLRGLAAPFLPVPLQPLMAGQMPEVVLQRHLQTGGLIVVPDTFPVPSRDEFRRMLDDALHRSPPEHLADWMMIIASDNTAKQAISRFARLFELQHYWRVLHHRHPSAFRRKTTVLKQIFASYFETGEQSIHQDLIEIRRRLGDDWIERGAGSAIGPF